MTLQRPTVFIGSSTKGLEIARQIRSQLADLAEVTIWNEGVFPPSETYIVSLMSATLKFDFAVLVLGGDDLLQAPEGQRPVPRDNVLFEFGLFMGCLGPLRTFAVYDKDEFAKIPSDLAGVSLPGFHGQRLDGNLAAAVGPACDKIRDAIRHEKPRRGSRAIDIKVDGERLQVTKGAGSRLQPAQVCPIDNGSSFRLRDTAVQVLQGLIQEAPTDGETGVVLPANEFFDDDCVNDPNSALGAFVQHHFGAQVSAFQQRVAQVLSGMPSTQVTKGSSGKLAASYGVGTCALLDRPLDKPLRLLLLAVTTDRWPQGLGSDMRCLVDGVRNCLVQAHQRRINRLVMPLMGAGHGGLRPEVSLTTMLLALTDAIRLAARGPASVTIVVYRNPTTQQAALSLDSIHDIVCATARSLA